MKLLLRTIALALPLIGGFSGCEFDEDFLGGPEPSVIYVQQPQRPVYFDPYYNRPKVYNDPVLFKSTEKKTKGNKIYKTTTIRNQYGNTVYKETTSQNKKKKKK